MCGCLRIHDPKMMRLTCRLAAALVLAAACRHGPVVAGESRSPADITPRYIVYYNSDATPLSATRNSDYTHVILSFVRVVVDDAGGLRVEPPKHMDGQWGSVPLLQAAGKRVLISFGGGLAGAEEYTALIGREPEVAALLAQWIQDRGLDGIDIDFEASEMFHQHRDPAVGDGRQFLIDLTRALRQQLPAPRYALSHAPEAPYLNPRWHAGPYIDVMAAVGDSVDWLIVQYYNNGAYDDPFSHMAADEVANTSYSHLTDATGQLRWPPNKVLIGKPIYRADAKSGHLSPDKVIDEIVGPMLATYGSNFGGLAGWQYSDLTDDHRAWNDRVGRALIQADR